jgi:hypothetical protein
LFPTSNRERNPVFQDENEAFLALKRYQLAVKNRVSKKVQKLSYPTTQGKLGAEKH